MSHHPSADPCRDEAGCGGPYEFVRLRYFFGQRLGVSELADEQAYVVGKQRLHNQLLHGAGVLCGLVASRHAPPGLGSRTTMLKVARGAALDACGREIIVGFDTCVDVAAWYRKNRDSNADLAAGTDPTLWVVVCYRECPSDPAPAPREACGCDATGCAYSRIREGFELRLVTRGQLPQSVAPGVHASLRGPTVGEEELRRGVVRAGSAPCPVSPDDACLVLARVVPTIDPATGDVIDLSEPDNAPAGRLALLSAANLQALVLRMAVDGDLGTALDDGPRVAAVEWDGAAVRIGVALGAAASGTAPLLGAPPDGVVFTVSRLDSAGTWSDLSATVTFDVSGSAFVIVVTGGWSAGRFRISGVVRPDHPVVDTHMRELRPRTFARHVRLELVSAALVLSPTLFDTP